PEVAIIFGIFIIFFLIYGLSMGIFLNFTPTDSSYVKRICKGFYDDSQIAEAYKYVMNERENILNFKDESDSYSDELRKIKKLYDEGILTEEEFKKAKKKILDI
ncbi:MAG: SHOCT domain-containing protein, partial [Candidatus Nanogingivalis sp.]